MEHMFDVSPGGRSGPTTLAAAIAGLLDGDLEALTNAELSATIVEIEQAQAALDAARLRYLKAWDDHRAWNDDGASSGGVWLAAHSGSAHSTARERIRVAHGTASMHLVRAALAEGRLSWSKMRLFSALVPDAAAAAFERDQAMLVASATELSVEHTKVMLLHWAARADPDGHDQRQRDRHRQRRLYLSSTLHGTSALNGSLDAETSLLATSLLDRIASQLRDDEVDADDGLARTAAQRRHDAFHEILVRAAAFDAERGRRATPSLLALIQYEALEDRAGIATVDGPPLTGAAANRLACDAGISRVITGPRSETLDLGRETRLFSAAQRHALLARHRGCAFPDCDRPPGWCEIHHIAEWVADAGPTDLANGAPLCHTHHHYVHEGGGSMQRLTDGTLQFSRPDGTLIEPGWRRLAGQA